MVAPRNAALALLTACLTGCTGFPEPLPEPLRCDDEGAGCIPLGVVEVPGGAFTRGSALVYDEQPIYLINVDTFFIDAMEVTVGDYRQCVESGICTPPASHEGCNWPPEGREHHPVNCVSWSQADQYCRGAGEGHQRLPTEAEWEKAARGTDARKFPWGDLMEPSCEVAVMHDPLLAGAGCGTEGTMEVGSKPAGVSVYGAHDMAGNVGEWVSDWYAPDYGVVGTDNPVGPMSAELRVWRGGSWRVDDTTDGNDRSLRTSNREQDPPEQQSPEIGFRCARSTSATPADSDGSSSSSA